MIRVLIVDDHLMFRQSLRTIIDSQHDMQVIGEAVNGLEALRQAQVLQPDIILMDINMPELDGIDATRRITSLGNGIKIIGLSTHTEIAYQEKMMAAGASDYISKVCDREDLLDCIRAVYEKRT